MGNLGKRWVDGKSDGWMGCGWDRERVDVQHTYLVIDDFENTYPLVCCIQEEAKI